MRAEGANRGVSIASALAEKEEAPPDPKAALRAEAQRQRLRQDRETSILAGLDELDLWISDHLHRGLAGFPAIAAQSCRTLAARLVDAKAPGVAALVDEIGVKIFRVPDAQRGDFVLSRLATLALLSAAYRRQDRLPPELIADVRRTVGWSVRREDVLEDQSALRVSAHWLVAANRSEIEPGKIRRLETWLLRIGEVTDAADAPRFALLLDFVPLMGGSASFGFAAGETFEAELAFYPSAAPLRALVGARAAAASRNAWPDSQLGLEQALSRRDQALARQPFIDEWPLAAAGVQVRASSAGQLFIVDGKTALPLEKAQFERALPLLGLPSIDVAGLWDGRTLSLFAANTPFGLWLSD